MLTLKYKTTKDFPGTPTGTVLVRGADGNYHDEATKFWAHQSMVENSTDFSLHEVSTDADLKFSTDTDVGMKAQQDLATAIIEMQSKLAEVSTGLAVANLQATKL